MDRFLPVAEAGADFEIQDTQFGPEEEELDNQKTHPN
jgi:hypothetical protein